MELVRSRKGVSAVLATLLMIVIAVAAAAIAYTYTASMIQSQKETASENLIIENVRFAEAADMNGSNWVLLVLRNEGTADVLIDKVYIDRALQGAYLSQDENELPHTMGPTTATHYVLLPEPVPTNNIRWLAILFDWAESTTYHFRVVTDKGVGIEGSFSSPPYLGA